MAQTVGKAAASLLPLNSTRIRTLMQEWIATAIGMALALAGHMDIIGDIGVQLSIEPLGYVITGIIKGHGVQYTMAFLTHRPNGQKRLLEYHISDLAHYLRVIRQASRINPARRGDVYANGHLGKEFFHANGTPACNVSPFLHIRCSSCLRHPSPVPHPLCDSLDASKRWQQSQHDGHY